MAWVSSASTPFHVFRHVAFSHPGDGGQADLLSLAGWGVALVLGSVVLWAEEVKKLVMRAMGKR